MNQSITSGRRAWIALIFVAVLMAGGVPGAGAVMHIPIDHRNLIFEAAEYSQSSRTVAQDAEASLHWAVEILHGLDALLPVDVQLAKVDVTGPADLCQLGESSIQPGNLPVDDDNADNQARLYPDSLQILNSAGVTLRQKTQVDITVLTSSTSEGYRTPYECSVKALLSATDGVDTQDLELVGSVLAVPHGEFSVVMGNCSAAGQTLVGCASTTASELGFAGTPQQPIPLFGTGAEGIITTAVTYKVTIPTGESMWGTEWYFDHAIGSTCSASGDRKFKGTNQGAISKTFTIPDETTRTFCYRANIWEDDPSGQGQDRWKDNDDLYDTTSFTVSFHYKRIAAEQTNFEGGILCEPVVRSLLDRRSVATSDVAACALDPQAQVTPSGLMIPIRVDGEAGIFGAPVPKETLERAVDLAMETLP